MKTNPYLIGALALIPAVMMTSCRNENAPEFIAEKLIENEIALADICSDLMNEKTEKDEAIEKIKKMTTENKAYVDSLKMFTKMNEANPKKTSDAALAIKEAVKSNFDELCDALIVILIYQASLRNDGKDAELKKAIEEFHQAFGGSPMKIF